MHDSTAGPRFAGSPAFSGSAWPRAAVFDCDGLLLDTEHCWHGAYDRLLQRHGRDLAEVDVRRLVGASVAGACRELTLQLGVVVSELELRAALAESFDAAPPMLLPGAEALVTALAQRMPLAVATNGPREVIAAALTRAGLHPAFTAIVSADDVALPKPEPDTYATACGRLGVAPADAIAFEDSALGARAARRAGLVVVGVPSTPGLRLDVDLLVGHLTDPRLLTYLGLAHAIALQTSAPAHARRA